MDGKKLYFISMISVQYDHQETSSFWWTDIYRDESQKPFEQIEQNHIL